MSTWLGALTAIAAMGISTTSASQITETFDAYAQTQVSIRSAGTGRAGLDWDDAEQMGRLEGVIAATALGRLSAPVSAVPVSGGRAGPGEVGVTATDQNLHQALELDDWQGRALDAGFHRRGDPVAVLGRVAAERLALAPPYGVQAIHVGGHRVTVIGVFSASPRLPEVIEQVLVPWAWADDAGLAPTVERLVIRTRIGAANAIAERAALVVNPYSPGDVLVAAPPTVEQLRARVTADVDLLVAMTAVGAILVGSLGIAHASFVGVLRRRGEFALRQSLGMTPSDVALLVLLEGALVGLVAGSAGTVSGVLVVIAVAAIQGWTPLLEPVWLGAAICLTAALGMVMSLYPARLASRVQPADGLRDL